MRLPTQEVLRFTHFKNDFVASKPIDAEYSDSTAYLVHPVQNTQKKSIVYLPVSTSIFPLGRRTTVDGITENTSTIPYLAAETIGHLILANEIISWRSDPEAKQNIRAKKMYAYLRGEYISRGDEDTHITQELKKRSEYWKSVLIQSIDYQDKRITVTRR